MAGPVQVSKWRLDTRRCRAVGSPPAFAVISAYHPRDASPPLHMAELLRKADELYVTLLTTTVSSISEAPTELATAVYACDVPEVNALFRNRGSGKGSTEYKKPSSESQLCWYHLKFRDQARYCTGLPCPRHRPDLKKGRKSQAGNATGGLYWCCI